MFGYVTINKDALSAEEYQRFRAQYCGLCHVLAQRYGKVGRAVLSYDMAFLSALLASLYEPEERAGEERSSACCWALGRFVPTRSMSLKSVPRGKNKAVW